MIIIKVLVCGMYCGYIVATFSLFHSHYFSLFVTLSFFSHYFLTTSHYFSLLPISFLTLVAILSLVVHPSTIFSDTSINTENSTLADHTQH